MRRMVGRKFYIENGNVFKTNGEPVPPEEPIFILRGRDNRALPLLKTYHEMCRLAGCNIWQLEGIAKMIDEFRSFSQDHSDRMKEPGVTKGL